MRASLDAAELLARQGIEARVIDMHTIKPIDAGAIRKAARETGAVMTVEEHNITGGLGSADGLDLFIVGVGGTDAWEKTTGGFQIVVDPGDAGLFQFFILFLIEKSEGNAYGNRRFLPDFSNRLAHLLHLPIGQPFPRGDDGVAQHPLLVIALSLGRDFIS